MIVDRMSAFPRRTLFGATALGAIGVLAACTGGDEDADPDRDIDQSLPYLELGPAEGVPVLDLLLDFRCPPCKGFAQMHSDSIAALVEEEKATVRIYPRPMLDEQRNSTYSQTCAAAAAAIYAQDPGLLIPFEKAMFEKQPLTNDVPDLPLREIVRVMKDAGADHVAVEQVKSEKFVDWTLNVVEPHCKDLGVGTPSLFLDGVKSEGKWSESLTFVEDLVENGLPDPSDGGF